MSIEIVSCAQSSSKIMTWGSRSLLLFSSKSFMDDCIESYVSFEIHERYQSSNMELSEKSSCIILLIIMALAMQTGFESIPIYLMDPSD